MDKDLIGSPKDSWININTSSNHEKFIQLIDVINKEIVAPQTISMEFHLENAIANK